MKKYTYIMGVAILISSLVILVVKLFSTAPIQIIMESGQEIINQDSNLFSLADAILLSICSFMVGVTSLYLYYNSLDENPISSKVGNDKSTDYEVVLRLLKPDERRVYNEIIESKGDILQNKIVLNSGLSKVRVTRILKRLEQKQLIKRERFGLTNRIKF
jgi:uncharacterized membrane protein